MNWSHNFSTITKVIKGTIPTYRTKKASEQLPERNIEAVLKNKRITKREMKEEDLVFRTLNLKIK